ncbi:MAG: hypothetical protein FD130_1956 [Halothiobacillaceae bacterium]|nr:MAG: hypothetical protein FD130_1956 [Halothiobacillaceae bacterium]
MVLQGGFYYDSAPTTGNPGISSPTSLPTSGLVRDTGTVIPGINEDYNRKPRKVGAAPDIGAIEYQGTP